MTRPAPDAEVGLAMLRGLAAAARTPEGRRLIGELVAEVQRAAEEIDEADPIAVDVARTLARAARRDRARRAAGKGGAR